jgi:hypothetical protein
MRRTAADKIALSEPASGAPAPASQRAAGGPAAGEPAASKLTTARKRPAGQPTVITVAVSVLLDVCCVLLFVGLGRHTHHNGDTLAGIWHTSWPFLAGLALGLVLARGWRKPMSIMPTGIAAWLGASLAGMLIRVLAGQGTAIAFIGVTLAFLALFMLGWRVAARIVSIRLRAAG